MKSCQRRVLSRQIGATGFELGFENPWVDDAISRQRARRVSFLEKARVFGAQRLCHQWGLLSGVLQIGRVFGRQATFRPALDRSWRLRTMSAGSRNPEISENLHGGDGSEVGFASYL